ncbi:VOC family protein, partial [Hyphomonas sp. UBA5107]
MSIAKFEHVNVTVSDPKKTASMLTQLFGWKVRWEGPSKYDGYTVHVGTDEDYLA